MPQCGREKVWVEFRMDRPRLLRGRPGGDGTNTAVLVPMLLNTFQYFSILFILNKLTTLSLGLFKGEPSNWIFWKRLGLCPSHLDPPPQKLGSQKKWIILLLNVDRCHHGQAIDGITNKC